jgi:nucleotide-binding universal stress UspA family protein
MSVRFPYQKILVPMDFSEDSRRACEHGLAVARGSEAQVALLTVIDETFPYPELFAWDHPNEEFYKAMRQRALEQMEEVVAGSAAAGLQVERIVVRGRPRQEIVAVAADWGADLVVLARHGSGNLRNTFMGSTSESVLRHAPCPVMVLPPPAA